MQGAMLVRDDQIFMPSPQPLPYSAETFVKKTWRFIQAPQATSPGVINITPAKLCALLTFGVTVNSAVVQAFEAVRIKSIKLWVSPSQTATIGLSQASISFPGATLGLIGSDLSASDCGVGMTYVAKCGVRLSPTSQTGQWLNGNVSTSAGQSTVFQLDVGAHGGAVLDLKLVHRVSSDTRLLAAGTVPVGVALVGSNYYLALDNPAGGTGSVGNTWTPDQVLSTTT